MTIGNAETPALQVRSPEKRARASVGRTRYAQACGDRLRSLDMKNAIALATNELLRHEVLETESVYRVIEVSDRLVAVEVVAAPGLTAGTRLRITHRAAQAMQCPTTQVRRAAHARHRRSLTARLRLAR